MGTMVSPAHPGECLRDSVRAMGWTVTEAARQLGLSRVMASRLLNGQARLTAAPRSPSSASTGATPSTGCASQASYDLAQERRRQAA